LLQIEIEGKSVDAETLWQTASAFGHFTAMQVRGQRTRGLALHLRRLETANHELFDAELDHERVRWLLRHALGEVEDASVRVYIFETGDHPAVMVTVKEPAVMTSPQRLQSVCYQRPEAHLKHLATEQGYHLRFARRNGFDDALLTTADGAVSETAIANIGFLDGAGVVWPDAPLLQGITMQLLGHTLPELGVPIRRGTVRLEDVVAFAGAFLANARGIAPVSQLNDDRLPVPTTHIDAIGAAYAAVRWETI
jgi:branched-subunit amino acid aminotransferase/4-amino-4-deoxychorismate lyase